MKPPATSERDALSNGQLIREHLATVLESAPFHASKRCSDLLRYVAEHTLDGHTEGIKERTIGERVFGRPDYDPAAENLVRVHANEVRKRLALFYQSAPESRVHIDLPAGSYIPEFRVGVAAGPARASRRGWWLAALAVAALAFLGWLAMRPAPTALDRFWAPALNGAAPLLISNPPDVESSRHIIVPYDDLTRQLKAGQATVQVPASHIIERTDMVSGGNVDSLVAIAMLLKGYNKPPEVRIASDLAPGDFQNRPLVHVGFNNQWAMEINRSLRFRFVNLPHRDGHASVKVQDSENRIGELTVTETRPGWQSVPRDYAIVSRLFSTPSGQMHVAVGGVTHLGTRAAGEFVTSASHIADLAKIAPPGWERKNLQIVLEVRIVGKTPGPPRIVAAHFW